MKSMTAAACTALLASGCSMGPVHVEEDFGRSVRQMVEAQISDPAAAADPASGAPGRFDGIAAEESLSSYRKRAKGEGDASREIRLSID